MSSDDFADIMIFRFRFRVFCVVHTIAHFRVALSLSIKARPGAQPFL